MGQAQSDGRNASLSHEQLAKTLADKFAQKCFTSLELYSFKDVFKSLADNAQGLRYLKEDTIAQFLEIPDVLGVSPVIFQMMSCIGAFPFLEDAPAVLGLEQMVMVVTILTERYRRVLARGTMDRRKLLFKSLAVYDRCLSEREGDKGGPKDQVDGKGLGQDGNAPQTKGFPIDKPGDDEDAKSELDEDDDLVLAALDSLDYIPASKQEKPPATHGAMIPADNWRKLIMLLLLIAPLDAQENLASYSNRLSGGELDNLRATADWILAAFLNVEKTPGIGFSRFNTVIPTSMPFMFDGLTALFEHFLFSKNLALDRRIGDQPQPGSLPSGLVQPLLQDTGSIMNLNILSQLSFFIPASSLFRRLRLLYSGDEDGFSMGSFESKVFNWRAPTLLLVSGTRLPGEAADAHSGPASAFLATLPTRRFYPENGMRTDDDSVTFGVYLSQPWKHAHRECFGTEDTLLFQLQPIHDVFHASTVNKDYASFSKPSASAPIGGITFGCPPPQATQASRRSNTIALGPVSLVLESSFEFGCFTHDYTSQGGAFQTSVARKYDFQDRFEVSSLEVWGCGGDDEARHQAERWAWEAMEAEARRRINLGTGDIDADRSLLEMAGLVGANRSGGSMG